MESGYRATVKLQQIWHATKKDDKLACYGGGLAGHVLTMKESMNFGVPIHDLCTRLLNFIEC